MKDGHIFHKIILKDGHIFHKIILKDGHKMIFRRKAVDKLKEWKETYKGKYAALLEGARRVGKSTIAREFAKAEYKSYSKRH